MFELSDGASPADTEKLILMRHAERCSECNELLTMWTSLLPEFLSDRDQLSEEPEPFFFSRQRLLIQDTIEARSRGVFSRWFENIFPAWNTLRFVPLRAGLLAVLLFASWTVCQTGTLPFYHPLRRKQQIYQMTTCFPKTPYRSLRIPCLLRVNFLKFCKREMNNDDVKTKVFEGDGLYDE